MTMVARAKYNEDQPRDERGRFGEGSSAGANVIPNPEGFPSPRGPVSGVVYHGQSHPTVVLTDASLTWTTNSREDAEFYRQSDTGVIATLYVDFQNAANEEDLAAAVVASGATPADVDKYSPNGGDDYINPNDYLYVPAVREELGRQGFDGWRGWDTMTNYEIQAFVPLDASESLRLLTTKVLPGRRVKYSDDQERDDRGRWSSGGGDGDSSASAPSTAPPEHPGQNPSSPKLRELAETYMTQAGLPYDAAARHGEYVEVDVARATEIARLYDAAKDEPKNPEVAAAYQAFKDETHAQYLFLREQGYAIEINGQPGQPYANSAEFSADIRDNESLIIFPTTGPNGEITGANPENPMLEKTGEVLTDTAGRPYAMTANDEFRWVHDFMGHAKEGNTTGPRGEENAWRQHSAMYSPDAARAMTTETRGQNSWVNFGPGNPGGNTPIPEREYAPQKVTLLPEWVSTRDAQPPATTKVLRGGVSYRFKDWNEEDHPRDADGRFGSGGDSESREDAIRGPNEEGRVVGTDKNGAEIHMSEFVLTPDRGYGEVTGVTTSATDDKLVGQVFVSTEGQGLAAGLPYRTDQVVVDDRKENGWTVAAPGWVSVEISHGDTPRDQFGIKLHGETGPLIAWEKMQEQGDVGRVYAVAYPAELTSSDPRVIAAREEVEDMRARNKEMEADLGLRNTWTGVVKVGISADSESRGAVGVKNWSCSVDYGDTYLRSIHAEYSETGPNISPTSPEERDMIAAHELAHGMSTAAATDQLDQPRDYRERPALEEGVVQGYVESVAQMDQYTAEAPAFEHMTADGENLGGANLEGGGAYSSWVGGLDQGLVLSTATFDNPDGKKMSEVTVGERYEFYRGLITTPLDERAAKLNVDTALSGYRVEFKGSGLGTQMGYVLFRNDAGMAEEEDMSAFGKSKAQEYDPSRSHIHDLIFTAETPAEAREILARVAEYLDTGPADWLAVARDAEALVMFATSEDAQPNVKAIGHRRVKYSEDQPRDERGRFGSGGSETTPENFRQTWRSEMTPAEGHAWAKAAGSKYLETVVHVTTRAAAEGIRGTGYDLKFQSEAGVAHERGAYFALDRPTAQFYQGEEMSGDRAVSAVVVLQNPVEMDWSDPASMPEGDLARIGEFRGAALEAAGLDPEMYIDSPDGNRYRAADDPETTTQALKEAGFDGVILRAASEDLSAVAENPSVGGSQLIVFDKEQSVTIGVSQMPPSMYDPERRNVNEDAIERAIDRAFAKFFPHVKEFDEDQHPRDEQGRWTDGGGGGGGGGEAPVTGVANAETLAATAYASLWESGGATLDTETNTQPTTGIAVASAGTKEEVYRAEDVTPKMIQEFIERHREELSEDGKFLGVWGERGFVHLDISEVFPAEQLQEAIDAGTRQGELAGYNLATDETISFAAGSGPENPINTASVEIAARELLEGKYVNLEQERGLSTLTEKLAELSNAARESGEKAPVIDLGRVTIEGTNLFLQDNLGIGRVEMPQFTGTPEPGSPADNAALYPKDGKGEVDLTQAFKDHLESMGITVTSEQVPAENLRATQKDMDAVKVSGMMSAIESGKLDPLSGAIWTTRDDYILDGHHRWGAIVAVDWTDGQDNPLPINTNSIDMNITDALREAQLWTAEMGIGTRAVGKSFLGFRFKHGDHDQSTHGNRDGVSNTTIPALPGTVPVPEGEVRLFHITPTRNAESIREAGLTVSHAVGETYGEPSQVWASAGLNSSQAQRVIMGDIMDSEYVVVEFHMPTDSLDVGRWTDAETLEARNSDVTIFGDVPVENIIAIHEPWEAAYRTLSGPDYIDAVRRGEYDNFLNDPAFPGYSRAIETIKRESKTTVFTPVRPLGRARVKEWNEEDHPRDERGRFGSGDGDSAAVAGTTGIGEVGARSLADVILAGPASSATNAADRAKDLKHENVIRIGTALLEKATYGSPLSIQLEITGERIARLWADGISNNYRAAYVEERLGFGPSGRDVPMPSLVEMGAREVAEQLQSAWMMSASDGSPVSWGLQLAVAEHLGIDTTAAKEFLTADQYGTSGDYGQAIGLPPETNPGLFDPITDEMKEEGTDRYEPRTTLERAEAIAESPAVKEYVAQVYADTQATLKEFGITEVSLYRGVSFDSPASDPFRQTDWERVERETTPTQDVQLNPLSSFSTEYGTAESFATQEGNQGHSYVISMTVDAERIFAIPTTGPGCMNETEVLVTGGPAKANVSDAWEPDHPANSGDEWIDDA